VDPDDRVLVVPVTRKRDYALLQEYGWYRLPYRQMPGGVFIEYLAFFLNRAVASGRAGIYCYARRSGVELALRQTLLPEEHKHPRARAWYYKIAVGRLVMLEPPVHNEHGHRFAFIRTTADRLLVARDVRDLYTLDEGFSRREPDSFGFGPVDSEWSH
jgi:hypothetical protein